RAVEAAQEAISSPLLDNISIKGAAGVLINITGGMDLAIDEVTTISTIIQEAAGDDAEIIFGAVHDSNMKEEVRVTVIATGFEKEEFERSDNVIRPDFRGARTSVEPRTHATPMYGTRQVMPAGPVSPPPAPVETQGSNGRESGGSTPVHKFPPPRPAPDPRMPSDLEIPTFIRRQMD
ncbi:MAG TPA: hypothetical protein VF647_24590, partial [Longimicrobium sp.]